jgi:hypothetical protein
MITISIPKRFAISAIILVSIIIGGFMSASLVAANGFTHAVMVKDLSTIRMDSGLTDFISMGSKVFFKTDDGTHGYDLWKTEALASGPKVDISVVLQGGSHPPERWRYLSPSNSSARAPMS